MIDNPNACFRHKPRLVNSQKIIVEKITMCIPDIATI